MQTRKTLYVLLRLDTTGEALPYLQGICDQLEGLTLEGPYGPSVIHRAEPIQQDLSPYGYHQARIAYPSDPCRLE